MPTHLTKRGLEADIVEEVIAILHVDGGYIVEGDRRVRLGQLSGSYELGYVDVPRRASVEWVIEVDRPFATVRVDFISQKGGTVRGEETRVWRDR